MRTYKKIILISYIAKKRLYRKEKKLYFPCFFLHLKNDRKIAKKNRGEPIKYVFKIQYKF
jgi:hypothetical protein